jgi:Isochorismatase family
MKPVDTALVFLDLQDPIVGMARTGEPARIRQVAAAAASIAAAYDLPAFASVVPFGAGEPNVISEIATRLPRLVTRARPGASPLTHERSMADIRAMNRPMLAVMGVFSEIVVLHAVLDALSIGYSVTVLADGCGGFEARSEQAAFDEMRRAGARVLSVPSFGASLVTDWSTPRDRVVLEANVALLTRQER